MMDDELDASLRALHLKLKFFLLVGAADEKASIKRALEEFSPEVIKSLFPHRVLGGGAEETVEFEV